MVTNRRAWVTQGGRPAQARDAVSPSARRLARRYGVIPFARLFLPCPYEVHALVLSRRCVNFRLWSQP